tara:strand:+ start:208 stop:1110 length:903 start_codon:yes stop_codon:yes gene_type:complete
MAYRKNTKGEFEYYYKPQKSKTKIIQKDWLKEHGYKRGFFPPGFFENVEKNLTSVRRGYWAYAIDGDGTFNLRRKCVAIFLKDREPIQQLADIYGTSISRIEFSTENWAPIYITQLFNKRALHFSRLICPHMTEKRKKATQFINMFDPNYHPPKISMDFRKNPDLIDSHIGMIAGFFDTEGSVGIRIEERKSMTKKFGERIYTSLNPWVEFSNTDMRPLRKIKKILETWPFKFKPALYSNKSRNINKVGKYNKTKYTLGIAKGEHLLFMKMFYPWILITRKRDYAGKFERKKQIYAMCKR